MKRQTLFALGAVVAAVLSTLAAHNVIWRHLSKIGMDVFGFARELFWRHTLPCLAAGLALVVLAICISDRRPRIAIALLIAAPFVVIVADLGLLTLNL